MGIMHTKAERTEKVKEIKAENEKKVKEVRAKKKELDAEVKKKAKQVAADGKKRRAGITFRLVMLAIVPVIVMVLGLITTTIFSLKSGLEEVPAFFLKASFGRRIAPSISFSNAANRSPNSR